MAKERGRLYSIFVDFKRAFDAIDDNLLWAKMNNLGMSAKLINIMKDFYGGANTRLRLPKAFWDAVDVTQDVL